MARVLWLSSRMAAALSGAIGVGLVAAVVLALWSALTCGTVCTTTEFSNGTSRCVAYGTTCSGFAGLLLFYLIWTPIYSVVLGLVPGLAALTLTPAKRHPWHNLPILVLATLLGFAIWLLLSVLLKNDSSGVGFLTLFVIPSATGLVVAFNIKRLPRALRLGANGY